MLLLCQALPALRGTQACGELADTDHFSTELSVLYTQDWKPCIGLLRWLGDGVVREGFLQEVASALRLDRNSQPIMRRFQAAVRTEE